MSQPNAIATVTAACDQVADGLPLAEVAAARDRVNTALAELAQAGTSGNPRFQAAVDGLTGLLADLNTVADDLTIAAVHVRAFRDRLG